ncbi:MAG: hypothetical protein U0232_14110 [Thermomicrobiales bacterium]
MASTSRQRPMRAVRGGWLLAAISAAFLAAALAACGGNEAATSIPATARAAATTVATNVPPGAGATAASAATTVAGNVPPNAVSTAAAMATAAAGSGGATSNTSGPQATVTGEVTKLDPAARTFTVRGTDGKDYDFTASANSQVDLAALATNFASKQQVTVTYRGTTAPYEVVSVR